MAVCKQFVPKDPAAEHPGRKYAQDDLACHCLEKRPAKLQGNGFGSCSALGERPVQHGLLRGFSRGKPLDHSEQERQGRQAVELDALFFQTQDSCFDLLPCAGELGFHSAQIEGKLPGDLPHGPLIVVIHTHQHPLAGGQLIQNLLHVGGAFLPLHVQLRGGLGTQIGDLRQLGGLLLVLGAQLREQHRRLLPQGKPGLIDRDGSHPGAKALRRGKLLQMGKGLHIGVLLDVQRLILRAYHGPDRAEDLLVGGLVQGGERCLVAGPCAFDQGGIIHRLRAARCLIRHVSFLLSVSWGLPPGSPGGPLRAVCMTRRRISES